MAEYDKSITHFDNGTLTENSLFAAADEAVGVGYASGKHSASDLGAGMCGEDFTYEALETGNKSIFKAINELNAIGDYATASGTLTAGQTSLTISDNRITADSMLDIYTSIYGVSPTSVTVSAGSAVLTFEAQASNMDVAINIKGAHGGGGGAASIESTYQRIDVYSLNNIPYTIYTVTADSDCLMSLVGTCATNTSSNQGYIYCEVNGTQVGESIYIPTAQEKDFNFDLELSTGDVVELIVSWDGSHTNCYFNLRLGKAVAK